MGKNEETAKEISQLLPTFLRHMFPFVFQPIDVPPSQVLALVSIQERNGCTLGELKDEMHVSAPTITGIIDRLERDKFVKRLPDEKDRRVTNVVLLKKGEAVIQQFRANIQKRWEYILSHADLDMEPTVKIMKKVVKGFVDGSI